MNDFFRNRSQYMETDENKTGKLQINTAVPQRSILSPFLFLVYTNYLPRYNKNNSKVVIFPVDTSFLNAGPLNQCILQKDLDRIDNCFSCNKLPLIISNCEDMHFGIGTPKALTLNNEKLSERNACNYFRVYLDNRLFFLIIWSMSYVVEKLIKINGFIHKVREMYSIKCLLLFYNSFAELIISYGIIAYGFAAKTNLDKIEKA